MTSLAEKVPSILVWHTVSNRERNIVRDSAWREKRDNKIPAQFQPLLKSRVQSVAVFCLPGSDCVVTSEIIIKLI